MSENEQNIPEAKHVETKDGRVHIGSEKDKVDETDPFAPVFHIIEQVQEMALPLIFGVCLAMILANAAPEWYKYNFTSAHHLAPGNGTAAHRRLSSDGYTDLYSFERQLGAGIATQFMENPDGDNYAELAGDIQNSQATQCFRDCERLKVDRLLLLPWPIFGHPVTLHFFANDLIMVFHFGLAVKEVTEALLPGGSLNPPSKAANPILATMGGVFGPVAVFIIILKVFMAAGMFPDEYTFEVLSKGWGIVTATDIPLAWLAALVVYGEGHPAIDYLLLLAVADDALGMVIIACFYQDPNNAAQPQWLLLVIMAMLLAYTFRKWHYRLERVHHQSWIPYVLICGTMSWIGLIKAKLHPALALVPIVPFMPGPTHENLEHLDDDVEERFEDAAADGHEGSGAGAGLRSRTGTETHDDAKGNMLTEHYEHARGRGITIQAGLYSGLIGHGVADALKVVEYDEDGNAHLNASTLDSFEHFWKIYVDFGLFLFALCNAGVQVKGAPGAMTWAILLSLIIGKYCGIMFFFKLSKKCLGYPAPLGIRTRHVRMIGLIASLGLTVALFVSDVAFTDPRLKDDARLGALLSGFVGFACYAISLKFDFRSENVEKEIEAQIEEELAESGAPSRGGAAGVNIQMGVVANGDADGQIVAKEGGSDSAAVI